MPAPFRPETSTLMPVDHHVGTMQPTKTPDVAELARDWPSPLGAQPIQLLFTDGSPEVQPQMAKAA